MRNLIKAVQSYAVSIIVGLFAFLKRLIASIARFLKRFINSVRPHATPPKSSLVKSGERLSGAVWPHVAPAKASLVKSGKWLSEAVRPHVAPAKASLVKFLKWTSKLIIRETIGAELKALFGGAIVIALLKAFGVSILGILGFSKAKIIFFLMLLLFL